MQTRFANYPAQVKNSNDLFKESDFTSLYDSNKDSNKE